MTPEQLARHVCDDACTCPVHRTPLIYWPAGDDHACQDITCRYGHGGALDGPEGWTRETLAGWGMPPGYAPDAAERQQYARLPVPDLDITEKPDRSEPEPDEVRSLMQGFAAARRPGCPYADVFGESPPGCRCAWCYQDGSGQ